MFEWFFNLFKKKKKLKFHSKRKNFHKKKISSKGKKIHKKIIFTEYCRGCHRQQVFKENKGGHYCCTKCGWNDPEDW